MFSEYAPLSWVVAGFAGLIFYAIAVFIYGTGQQRFVRSRYDASFVQESGGVDPLSNVFEKKRIFLNDFVLPSSPIVDGKTFIDCEIVGPANVYLEIDNSIANVRPGRIDSVALNGENQFFNGFLFRNCTFRGCTLHRVTPFFSPEEAQKVRDLDWLNWISVLPAPAEVESEEPIPIEDQSDQLPTGTEEETPP